MRKITAAMLIIAVISSFLCVNVFAADTVIRSENGTYNFDFEKGKTFDISFVVDNNPGIHTASFIVNYDQNVIRAVKSDNEELDGYLSYNVSGREVRFIENSLVNQQLDITPNNGGGKKASELGSIRICAYAMTSTGGVLVQGDKKLFTMTFEMVGEGSSDVTIEKLPGYINKTGATGINSPDYEFYQVLTKGYDDDYATIPISVEPAVVNLKAAAKSTTTTTEKTTQTTTKSNTTTQTTTKSASNGSGTIDNTAKNTTTQTTTAETTTQAATESVTAKVENTTETTTYFTDIAPYPWAEHAINILAGDGIINGVGNGLFDPSANVKRADFMIMLVRALHFEADVEENFDDVTSDKYYYEAVGIAKKLGIASGQGDNKFNPESYISRQDMMVLAKRAVEVTTTLNDADESVLDKFDDKNEISPYAVDSLAVMVNEGIVSGTGNNIEPKANTTRAQAAVIVYKILGIAED